MLNIDALPLHLQSLADFVFRWCGLRLSRGIAGTILLGALALLEGCSSATKLGADDLLVQRANKAMAMFQERCKTAGVKIYRTVDSVDGIFVMKRRPEKSDFENRDAVDPYGRDYNGDGYLMSLLRGSDETWRTYPEKPVEGAPPRPKGYLYLEAIDPHDGRRYRYVGRIEEPWQTNKSYSKGFLRFVMDKSNPPDGPPRYGITYDDIATREEREHWMAGSSLKVLDLQTGEVVAERIGYMVDPGQGSTAGGRAPWLIAANYACPLFRRGNLPPPTNGAGNQGGQTQYFVEQVLRPAD